MRSARAPRRRSPGFVREWSTPALHAVAHRFNMMRMRADLSDQQEWLFDAIISELEYRRRRTRPRWKACSCLFCFGPFEE